MNTTTTAFPVQLTISLRVAAPFNTAAAEPGALGVDTPLLRDHRGRPIVPGSLLQGRVVEEVGNWGAEHFPALVSRQGRAAAPGSANQPQRKVLVLGDLVLKGEGDGDQAAHRITRISLQTDTRSVESGALQTLESAAASGAPLCFIGQAHAFVHSPQDAQDLCQQLQAALRLVPNVGAERSIGFGQITAVDVELKAQTDAAQPALTWPERATAVDIALQFDRPIVITDAPLSDNGFEATDVIAGNVLKGVFSDTCAALGLDLSRHLHAIVFRHAFCAASAHRPRVNPASLVEADMGKDKPLLDLAACKGPVLLGEGESLSAPRFALDWKDDDARDAILDAHFGRATPGRQLRVRTAIDPTTRSAEDNKLFAYEALLHEQAVKSQPLGDDGTQVPHTWQPHTWRTRIDLSALSPEDQQQARTVLDAVLKQGLFFLGKTKAIARVTAISAEPAEAPEVKVSQTLVITLQTPALLTAAQALLPGASAQDLLNAYRAYFDQASAGSLSLNHFYARQKLRGGGYQRLRFQSGAAYRPWLLTDAGAVFALTVKDADRANKTLQDWLARGLPLAEGCSTDWRQNPYQSANGFGEIAIDQSCHGDWAPEKKGIACRSLQPTAAQPA